MTGEHTGAAHFARVISNRINQHMDAGSGQSVNFGSIQSGYSLRVNGYSCAFPQSGYKVCQHVGTLRPGDSVVIAWVGSCPVVIGRIGD